MIRIDNKIIKTEGSREYMKIWKERNTYEESDSFKEELEVQKRKELIKTIACIYNIRC